MKRVQHLLCLIFLVNLGFAQTDFLGLTNIEHGPSGSSDNTNSMRPPSSFNATPNGGSIETYLVKNDGCRENYRFEWTFDRDISQLDLTQDVTGILVATKMSGDCSGNAAYFSVSGSNNGSAMIGKKKKAYSSLAISGKYAYASGYDHLSNTSTMVIKKGRYVPEEAYFTFKIVTITNASSDDEYSYEIRYEYEKNASTAADGFNCQGLYDLGVNIGMMEYGAHNNDEPAFVAEFIDNAISNISGIGCISPAYLKDLKIRLLKNTDSFTFYREISNYRQNIQSEISKCAE